MRTSPQNTAVLVIVVLSSVLSGFLGCDKKSVTESVSQSTKDSASDNTLEKSNALEKSINAFNHRIIHKTLDAKTLASIADKDLEQAIVDYAATKLDGHNNQESEILATLPEGVRALWLTSAVDDEVNNGGFNQYYRNVGDRFAGDAVGAFRFFSAIGHASLMQEANVIRTRELHLIDKFKDKGTLEAFSESYKVSKLGPLDSRYFALKEDLGKLRIAKIRSAPQLFYGN